VLIERTLLALATQVGTGLAARRIALTTAESCTGGLIAAAITHVAGASEWFSEGFVTYSDLAKHKTLSVPVALLEQHGAVSEAVAGAMSEGALAKSGADIAVSVTGIAGPTGAVPGKPVGTVCFGWAQRHLPLRVVTCHFPGNRAAVRRQAAEYALRGVLEAIDAEGGNGSL